MAGLNVTWRGGLRFEGEAESGRSAAFDAPVATGGDASAPTPMETVLMALAACSGVDVVNILKRMREPLAGLSVVVDADRADGHPRVFTRIRMRFLVEGDCDRRKVERAVNLSTRTYCSVGAMLAATAEITHEIEYRPVPDSRSAPGQTAADPV